MKKNGSLRYLRETIDQDAKIHISVGEYGRLKPKGNVDQVHVMKEVYNKVLGCIALPIVVHDDTQIYDSDKMIISSDRTLEKNLNGKIVDDEDTFQMRLIKTANRIFNIRQIADYLWKDITSNIHYDETMGVLLQRQQQISSHEFYCRENFVNDDDYTVWKVEEMKNTENLLEKALETRKNGNYSEISMTIKQLHSSAKVKGTFSVSLKVNDATFHSKFVRGKNSDAYTIDLENIRFSKIHATLNATIHGAIFQKSYLSTVKIGKFQVNLVDLINQYHPSNAFWGTISLKNQSVQIESQVGMLNFDVSVKFARFPNHPTDLPSTYNFLNGFEMYDILCRKIISETDASSKQIFDFYEKTILHEFGRLYGVSEIHRRLILIRSLVERIDLIVPFFNELDSAFKFVHLNVESKFVLTTKYESQMCKKLKSLLLQKIEVLLCDFIHYFPENKPTGALKKFVMLFETLHENYNGLSSIDQLELCVQSSMLSFYNREKHDLLSEFDMIDKPVTIGIMKRIADSLSAYLQTFNHYIDVFDQQTGFNFVSMNAQTLSRTLFQDVKTVLTRDQNEPMEILQLMNSIQNNIGVVEKSLGHKIDFPVSDYMEETMPKFLNKIETLFSEWCRNAISHDSFQVIDGFKHSTSIVDIFTTVESMSSFFSSLEFLEIQDFEKFSLAVCNLSYKYSSILQKLAFELLSTIQESTIGIPPKLCVYITNLSMCRKKSNLLIENMLNVLISLDQSTTKINRIRILVSGKLKEVDNVLTYLLYSLFMRAIKRMDGFVVSILKLAKEKENTSFEDVDLSIYKSDFNQLWTSFLTDDLDEMLNDISAYLYNDTFKSCLEIFYLMVVNLLTYFLLGERGINPTQVMLLSQLFDCITEHLQSNDEGISKESANKTSKTFRTLIRITSKKSTDSLISYYLSLIKNPKLAKKYESVFKPYHILLLIKSRNDQCSKQFVSKHQDQFDSTLLRQKFDLESDQRLITVREGKDLQHIDCKISLTVNYLCIEKRFVNEYITFDLKDLTGVSKVSSLTGAGMEVKTSSHKETLFFQQVNDFLQQITSQAKISGNAKFRETSLNNSPPPPLKTRFSYTNLFAKNLQDEISSLLKSCDLDPKTKYYDQWKCVYKDMEGSIFLFENVVIFRKTLFGEDVKKVFRLEDITTISKGNIRDILIVYNNTKNSSHENHLFQRVTNHSEALRLLQAISKEWKIKFTQEQELKFGGISQNLTTQSKKELLQLNNNETIHFQVECRLGKKLGNLYVTTEYAVWSNLMDVRDIKKYPLLHLDREFCQVVKGTVFKKSRLKLRFKNTLRHQEYPHIVKFKSKFHFQQVNDAQKVLNVILKYSLFIQSA